MDAVTNTSGEVKSLPVYLFITWSVWNDVEFRMPKYDEPKRIQNNLRIPAHESYQSLQ